MPHPATATRVPDSCQPTKPPDWDLVPFEVGCARCGHDLRGLSEPKCPACGLEFDWAHAVPIEQLACGRCGYHLYGLQETRCPECGEAFTWQQVLDDYRRRRKPLFEYHWRTRPVRSFLATLWLSLRPWKLWRLVDIHDPPNGKGLALMIGVAALLAFPFSFALALVCDQVLDAVEAYYGWGRIGLSYRFALEWLASVPGFITIWAIVCICATVGTLGTLLLLRQSMRLCKVRNSHVFRAWSYGMLPILSLITPSMVLLGCGADLITLIVPGWNGWKIIGIASYSTAFLWLWMVVALRFAYARYLRMRHAIWVALASQAVAFGTAMLPQAIVTVIRLG